MSQTQVKFLLTDAGNVLTTFKYRMQLVREILAGFGVEEADPKIFGQEANGEIGEELYHQLDIGTLRVQEVWEKLVSKHGLNQNTCDFAIFLSLWCRHLEPVEPVVKLYKKLQDKYPLVVVSNSDDQAVRHLIYHLTGSYGLKFRKSFISAAEQCKKPELIKKAAEFVIQQGGNLGQCVFVDDLQEYVEASWEIGLPAIQFNALEQTGDELEARLAEHGFVL